MKIMWLIAIKKNFFDSPRLKQTATATLQLQEGAAESDVFSVKDGERVQLCYATCWTEPIGLHHLLQAHHLSKSFLKAVPFPYVIYVHMHSRGMWGISSGVSNKSQATLTNNWLFPSDLHTAIISGSCESETVSLCFFSPPDLLCWLSRSLYALQLPKKHTRILLDTSPW